jgi:1-pyrroline-5-carboxylate dehydrogenase
VRKVETEAKIVSINPADKEEVVGKVSKASQEHAEQAIQAAAKAFEEWRYTSLKKERLFCSARLPKSAAEKHEFSALACQRSRKTLERS